MNNYTTISPVLFLVFNRPDTTIRVFEEIRKAKPAKLYVAADGPRGTKPGEDLECAKALSFLPKIDWTCQVKTLIRSENLGCKDAVSSAIQWFFEHEEEGIILEDDCLPSNSFFRYCDTMLDKFRDDTRIRHIAGCNLHRGKKWGEDSIFFTNQTHIWGWASWRRVWKDYDKGLTQYQESEISGKMKNIFADPFIVETWTQIFKEVKAGNIDTWDYQLAFLNFLNNGLAINPNVNLISNIGFGVGATHTLSADSIYANLPLEEMDVITTPIYVLPEKQADYAILSHDFNLPHRWKKHNSFKRKIKRFLKNKLKLPST